MTTTSVVFVFYTMGTGGHWTYGKLPKSWHWIGSGMVNPLGKTKRKQNKFIRDEQFNGDKKNRKQMRDYLNKYFTKLQERGVVKFYKIRNSYLA